MKNTKVKNKKILVILVFALIVAFLVSAGTVAWLTAKSSITNTFTVGSFEIPTTSPENAEEAISIDGNIYEPNWDSEAEHKLIPSATFVKDPYVGLGAGSESAVVYVYVENTLSENVYFEINSGWEAVANETTAGSKEGSYTSGLFKYTDTLSATSEADAWTTAPLFSQVVVADDATATDFEVQQEESPEITVSCFIHQATDGTGAAITASVIEDAAKVTFGLN